MKYLSLCLVAVTCSQCVADKNAEIAPVLAKVGDVVFSDDFDRDALGEDWSQIRGEWKIENGEISGREVKSEKHAAVFHCMKKNRNSIVRFSFKLNGAKEFHFSMNHARGHLFRAVVTENSLLVRTDGDKRDKTIKSKLLGKVKGKFQQGKWYTMQIEMQGDQVAVTTDNGLQVTGKHERLDTDKPNYRWILKDEHLAIDDIKIWSTK